MLTRGEDVEVHALRKRGWSYVAIGRHIGRDWRTVKAYVEGREPGRRRRPEPDPLERFAPDLKARFVDDPHVWASALYDEVVDLDYGLSYRSFARQLRTYVRIVRRATVCAGATRSRPPTPPAKRSSGTGSNGARRRGGRDRERVVGDAAAFGSHPRGDRRGHRPALSGRGDVQPPVRYSERGLG